jgi:hypothetical protein
MSYDNLVKNWNSLTNDNAHGKALEILANSIGMKKEAKILAHVNNIHALEGHMPNDLLEYRERLRKNVFKYARQVMGADFERLA